MADGFPDRANGATPEEVERVLDAERQAEQGLEDARREAEAVLAAARTRAEAIRKRADERISRLHIAMRRRIDAGIARQRQIFEQTAGAARDDPHVADGRAALERAVNRLAARLTGQDDGHAG